MSLWARFCALSSTWRPRGQRTLMMRCGLVAQPGRHPWRSPPSVPVAVLLKKFKKCSFVFGRILFYIVFSGFVHSSTSPGGSYFALSSGFVLRGAGALCLAAHHLLSTPSYHANAPGGAQSCNSHTHFFFDLANSSTWFFSVYPSWFFLANAGAQSRPARILIFSILTSQPRRPPPLRILIPGGVPFVP